MKYGIFALVCLLAACSVDPRPIRYGTDQCAHCDMTIMDYRYGAELVTGKGKIYTFDSIECLVDFLQKKMPQGEEARHIMVTPYTRPGNLMEVTQAWFLHSKAFPSPMGMYLTAFGTEQDICATRREHGGMIFDWEELLKEFQHLDPSLLGANK